MVKADLSRDYYGDLQLQPGADIADIKKQFKKLALTFHPDRNPGRENEVTAQFQMIQSAHEVLTDPTERAKYDNNRVRSSRGFGSAYAGSSGVRGNPWSDVSSQYPPPPKAPTARRGPQQPSAGAERYKKWEAPKQSAYQAAHEGAGARQKTYEAWESMKTKPPQAGYSGFGHQSTPSSGKPNKGPQVPPRNATPQESSSNRPSSSTRPPPTYHNMRADSPPRRSNSTSAFKKGFMPNTPGGDEPPASKGAYFTQRNKSAVPPDLPAREPQSSPKPARTREHVRSEQFPPTSNYSQPAPEPRISTPYATHGGEKLNPFDNASIHRSKSARESPQRFSSDAYTARPSSSSNLFGEAGPYTPHRSQSTRAQPSPRHHQTSRVDLDTDSDSSDEGPILNSRSFGKGRPKVNNTNGATPVRPPSPKQAAQSTPVREQPQRKPSKISQFQQWYKENPNTEPPVNGFPPEGPPQRANQQQQQQQQQQNSNSKTNDSNAEPSMYASSSHNPLRSHTKRASTCATSLPTVSEGRPSPSMFNDSNFLASIYHNSRGGASVVSPSGEVNREASLTFFEVKQRNILDKLLDQKASSGAKNAENNPETLKQKENRPPARIQELSGHKFTKNRDTSRKTSISNKPRSASILSPPLHCFDSVQARTFWNSLEKIKTGANQEQTNRFSFNVNDETFQTSEARRPSYRSFSSSAENISTKFSSKEWDGKFAGAEEYFKPDPKAPFPPSRSQSGSGSRSRGRSPTKPNGDPRYKQGLNSEGEPVVESPGGTKFSAEEWANTFKPQSFAPPPAPRQVPQRKRTGTNLRPTVGGNAAVVDDGNLDEGKPLFDGRKSPLTPNAPATPDAMDIDMPPPPPPKTTVPQFTPPTVDLTSPPRSPKRPAASPAEDASLKVNFSDLKIQDLITTLSLPPPPAPPSPPSNLPNTRPSEAAYEDYAVRFAKYMTSWDLYNNQFLLHLVARKNQNDGVGKERWLSDEGVESYRRGLKEDRAVLEAWAREREIHEEVVRDWTVLRERLRDGREGTKEAAADEGRRMRTKTG